MVTPSKYSNYLSEVEEVDEVAKLEIQESGSPWGDHHKEKLFAKVFCIVLN